MGKTVRETSARLGGIKTLGDDAEILVVSEIADKNKNLGIDDSAVTRPKRAPITYVPDFAASLNEEKVVLTRYESHRQIENLRPEIAGEPNEPQHVSQATFVKLQKTLNTGFTHWQLAAFYSIAKHVRSHDVDKKVIEGLTSGNGTPKRPVKRSEWQPGTTDIMDRLPGLDVTIRPKKMSVSKQLMVDRILRECWKLEPLEEIEAPGEIEMSLQPWQIALLNVGESDTVLDKIGQTRRAKFEFHQQHGILRITADKTTAEYATNDIEEALANTESKHLNLRPWLGVLAEGKIPKPKHLASMFSQIDIDTVSMLTRTVIEKVDGAIIWIRGLDGSAVAEAERLLIRLLPLNDQVTHSIDAQIVEVAKDSNYLMPVFLAENALDQKNRKAAFGRNLMPKSKSATPKDVEVSEEHQEEYQEEHQEATDKPVSTPETYSAHVDRVVAAMHRSAADISPPPKAAGSWSSKSEYFMSAELGQALFPLNTSPPTTTTPEPTTTTVAPPLTFNPFTPGLTSLLTSPQFTATNQMQGPSLIYDFIPSAIQPSFNRGQLLPDLRIQMRTGRAGSNPRLHYLTLGFDKRIHNVLLPNKAVDIRFRSSARLKMKNPSSVEVVKEWLEQVKLNVEQGGRLWAPDLELEIPTWTIPGETEDAPESTKPVKYLFSAVSFRQSITGMVGDTMVSFRTLQSGKLGGQTGVLSAHYTGHGDVLLRNQDEIREFARKAFALVDLVEMGAGATVPVAKRMNPRAVVSARKLRRAQEQAAQRAMEEGEVAVGLEKPWEPLGEGEGESGESGAADGVVATSDEATVTPLEATATSDEVAATLDGATATSDEATATPDEAANV